MSSKRAETPEPRRVFLTGATGFVGSHVLQAIVARGHHVTCLVRPESAARLRKNPRLKIVPGDWTRPETWSPAVDGHDVVVNCVGIIRERRRATFLDVHTFAALALFDAAVAGGASKVVQLSALGADELASSQFHRSKRVADRYLARLGIPYVVIRPSFVYGPGDRSMSFFARLARLPLTPVPGAGAYRVQPIHIDDLTRAIVACVDEKSIANLTIDAAGATALTFNELLTALAHRDDRPSPRLVRIPWPLMTAVATLSDVLGNRGPITSDELSMLRRGNTAELAPFKQVFGFTPRAFG